MELRAEPSFAGRAQSRAFFLLWYRPMIEAGNGESKQVLQIRQTSC